MIGITDLLLTTITEEEAESVWVLVQTLEEELRTHIKTSYGEYFTSVKKLIDIANFEDLQFKCELTTSVDVVALHVITQHLSAGGYYYFVDNNNNIDINFV